MAFALEHKSRTQYIALLCLVFTNFIFAWKYLDRVTSYALIIAVIYSVAFLFIALYLPSTKINLSKKWITIVTIIGVGIISFILFQKIEPLSVKVDRWSVISSFWDAAFNGEYPYFAKSHRGAPPGPLPIYFLIGLPFYLLGEIGWYATLGLFIFLWFLYKKRDEIEFNTVLLITLFSIAILYEILVRSTIFTNSVIFLLFFEKIKSYKFNQILSVIGIGLLAGVLLSTRMVYGLCFAVYLIHGLKTKQISWSNSFLWGFASLIGLAITILPFYLLFPKEFLVQNPFNIQGTYSMEPFWQPLFLILAIILGLICKNNFKIHFMNGMVLFLVLFIYVVYHLFTIGLIGVFNGRIDISYLLFSFPFLLYYFALKPSQLNDQQYRQ